jgi:hypothetical protein
VAELEALGYTNTPPAEDVRADRIEKLTAWWLR